METLQRLWLKFRALPILVQVAIAVVIVLALAHYGGVHEGSYIPDVLEKN